MQNIEGRLVLLGSKARRGELRYLRGNNGGICDGTKSGSIWMIAPRIINDLPVIGCFDAWSRNIGPCWDKVRVGIPKAAPAPHLSQCKKAEGRQEPSSLSSEASSHKSIDFR